MSEEMKKRIRSKATWISLAALVPVVLQIFGFDVLPKDYSSICNMVLTLLVALGVLNNPTTEGKWYLDDKNQVVVEQTEDKAE
jgi:uncharacterized membrane protein